MKNVCILLVLITYVYTMHGSKNLKCHWLSGCLHFYGMKCFHLQGSWSPTKLGWKNYGPSSIWEAPNQPQKSLSRRSESSSTQQQTLHIWHLYLSLSTMRHFVTFRILHPKSRDVISVQSRIKSATMKIKNGNNSCSNNLLSTMVNITQRARLP